MNYLAIIGGTGLTELNNLNIVHQEVVQTPFGEPSGPLNFGEIAGTKVMFLSRHGASHTIPPHKVNYRANIWALHQAGASYIIAVNAVGGITTDHVPSSLSIPDQLIDYTYSRVNTFFEEDLSQVVHIDFTNPYCESLRNFIITKANKNKIQVNPTATYAVTEGPRLESSAEIVRLERDGCDIVGMTGMPETALAKELNICYASIAIVANLAAGKGNDEITMDIIKSNLEKGLDSVKRLLEAVIPEITAEFINNK